MEMLKNSDFRKLCRRPFKEWLFNKLAFVFRAKYNALATRPAASLMERAMQITGLSDFGDGPPLKEGIDILLNSYRRHGRFTTYGWFRIHDMLISHLKNRLLIQHEITEHPEILKEKIVRPIFVVGLARSGTTMTQRLLAADPANRGLLLWEALRPAPAPRAETRDSDPRIAEAEEVVRRIERTIPHYSSIHKLGAQIPEECRVLFMNAFVNGRFGLYGPTPEFTEWERQQDIVAAYRYYRMQLQILQHDYHKERWVLKTPSHLKHLKVLLKVFPDASIVCIHRDPAKIIPSASSLVTSFHLLVSDNPVHIGNLQARTNRMVEDAGSLIEICSQMPSGQFFDVHYKTFIKDPIPVVRRMYNHFEYPFTDDTETAMRRWLDTNSQHKHGIHKYSLEQFGYNREEIYEKFKPYIERFDIPLES